MSTFFSKSGASPPRRRSMEYPTTTPLMMIHPERIRIVPLTAGMIKYQRAMSKARWRPSYGRNLGFLVVQDDALLGLIFLATPVIRLTVRDNYLFPGVKNPGNESRSYMDMSVCVAAQPIGWHWRIGKLLALIAPTLGDYIEARYPENKFKGIVTTSIFGGNKATQYTRIYKYLGETEGHGHENVDDATMKLMMKFLRARCPHCSPKCDPYLIPRPSKTQIAIDESPELWCVVPGCRWVKGVAGDGCNPRMRRIQAFYSAIKALGLTTKEAIGVDLTRQEATHHGHLRGVYYHAAVPPEQRAAVIQRWYERWGLPGYEKTKELKPPYYDGQTGGRQYEQSNSVR
jgi:hypothetical protein